MKYLNTQVTNLKLNEACILRQPSTHTYIHKVVIIYEMQNWKLNASEYCEPTMQLCICSIKVNYVYKYR